MADRFPKSPAPADLDLIGTRFNIPVFRMEELVALRRLGASDDEMLASLLAPSADDEMRAQPIDLTDSEGKQLLAELSLMLG